MPPSDPFDDEEDDFFNNTETLDILAAVEERAIRASQVPKSSQAPSYHHTLAKPKARAQLVKKSAKDPGPLNTEPRAGNSGFGWEYGGKRSIDGNVERHLKAIDDRQAYWSHGNAPADGGGSGRKGHVDSSPPDVVMDASGRYGLGLADEAVVTDNRKAQQAALEESLGLAKAPQAPQLPPPPKREVSAEAAAARRRAIAEAATAGGSLLPRAPLSRSNSASSTTSSHLPGPSRSNLTSNNARPQPADSAPKFSSNRALSRSISAGGQVFHRPNAAAGPSRLPTIPSQTNEASPYGSQGAPPASQGSAARQAAIELEQERRKRQELEAELLALRNQANKIKERAVPQRDDAGAQAGVPAVDSEQRVKDLQSEVWRAKGEAETMRRAQKEEHSRHLAEIEKLRAALADKDVQIKERETMQKRAVESIKHQAVFSNHALQNSAMKNRQPSQRPASSQRPQPTPLRTGSPGRQMFSDAEMTPLAKSVKGKGLAPPPPAPAFGGFSNAFAATPTVGTRVKRQRTEALSPQPQYPAQQSSPNKASTSSPFNPSPTKSRNGASSPALGGAGDEHDFFGAFAGMDVDVGPADQDVGEPSDQKAELLYHLFNHVAVSSFQRGIGFTTEPTIFRVFNYRPASKSDPAGTYAQACSDLLKACGIINYGFEELIEVVAEELYRTLSLIGEIIRDVEAITIHDVAVLFSLLSMLSSTALLFPSLAQSLATRSIGALCRDITIHLFSDQAQLEQLRKRLDAPRAASDSSETADIVPEVEKGTDAAGWHLEVADALVELCELLTFRGEGADLWGYQQLIDIILHLTATHQDTFIVQRGVDLFYTASCFRSNFQNLIATSDTHKVPGDASQSPIIERLGRWLIDPLPTASYTESLKRVLTILRGLCMLAISHADAAILMAQRSILVAALILVLQREGTKIWGVHAELHSHQDALHVVQLALALLHHLVFPSPLPSGPTSTPTHGRTSQKALPAQAQNRRRSHGHSASQGLRPSQAVAAVDDDVDRPTGINLADRLKSATLLNEFNGLQHVFVSALGCMAYGAVGEDVVSEAELRSLQFLAQDLLETVVEGPEGDFIFEIYVHDDDTESAQQDIDAEGGAALHDVAVTGGGDGDVSVDMDAYAAMDVDGDDYE